MNLKTYNAQNAPHKVAPKHKKYQLTVNSTGRFTIGRRLFEVMGKPAGVVILQDTQYPTDFYVKASDDPMAFHLKEAQRNHFIFHSNTLAGIIASALKITPPYSVKFIVTEKEDGLYCLGTRKPIIKSK